MSVALVDMIRYSSVSQFTREKRVLLPRPHPWYLVSPDNIAHGEINGVPSVRGTTVVTNGILVALETETGNVLFGHIEWFVPDAREAGSWRPDKTIESHAEKMAKKYV